MKKPDPVIDRSASLFARRWQLAGLLGLPLLALALLPGRADHPAATNLPPDSARPVRVVEVFAEPEQVHLRLPGVTRAAERVELAFQHPGHLAERPVRRGQQVAQGEILARLRHPALTANVSAAEARVREVDEQLAQLGREIDRLEELHRRDLVATGELERLVSQRHALLEGHRQAEAVLSEARAQLAETLVRAPFSGTVVELHAEPGQFIPPGQPVVSLAGAEVLEVELRLPAHRAARLAAGQTVSIHRVNGGHAHTTARISEIGLAAPGRPATVMVVINPDEPGAWWPGQAVHVDLNWPEPPVVRVPLAAVVDPGTGAGRVFRINGDKVERIAVQTGGLKEGWVAVSGPLEPGDRVVSAGHSQLLDGERVRVLP